MYPCFPEHAYNMRQF